MGDGRCDGCGARIPEPGRAACRRCGRAAHRQAAWRVRRRWQQAASARQTTVAAGAAPIGRVQDIHTEAQHGPSTALARVSHSAAVATVPEPAGQLVHLEVTVDREAGAGWARIGAGLGIGAEAAPSRYGRARLSPAAARGG